MKVKEIMSAEGIKSCTPETTLSHAAKLMKETNRGSLPVVDASHKVVGIVTDRDICLSLGAKAKAAKPAGELNVRDVIAHAKLHTVTPDQTITEALREMRRNKVGRLPVTDKEGKLKGVLSINNILTHALVNKKELGLVSDEDSLASTIQALFERNNAVPKKEKEALEMDYEDE